MSHTKVKICMSDTTHKHTEFHQGDPHTIITSLFYTSLLGKLISSITIMKSPIHT